jgi:hypothetical protein
VSALAFLFLRQQTMSSNIPPTPTHRSYTLGNWDGSEGKPRAAIQAFDPSRQASSPAGQFPNLPPRALTPKPSHTVANRDENEVRRAPVPQLVVQSNHSTSGPERSQSVPAPHIEQIAPSSMTWLESESELPAGLAQAFATRAQQQQLEKPSPSDVKLGADFRGEIGFTRITIPVGREEAVPFVVFGDFRSMPNGQMALAQLIYKRADREGLSRVINPQFASNPVANRQRQNHAAISELLNFRRQLQQAIRDLDA